MNNLTLAATAIGSLPYDNPSEAVNLIYDVFCEVPFWPQLAKVSKLEDMIVQYSQKVPGIFIDEKESIFGFNPDLDNFYENLEEFYLDYDEIVNEKKLEKLDVYGIMPPYTCSIDLFLEKLKKLKPHYAKGHVTGPFTWATSVCDNEKKCIFYDETYRDIVIKALSLKALWQIEKIKSVSPDTTPIIFIDEPTMSQFGTSAFLTINEKDITECLQSIINVIKNNNALAAIHCCGKTDWNIILNTDVDIINFDAYSFSKSLSTYSEAIKSFLSRGGYIAWGIVPTLDREGLENSTVDSLFEKFEAGIDSLAKKGINKEKILTQSIITPSCGAGSLDINLAKKAMEMTKELSIKIKTKYEVA